MDEDVAVVEPKLDDGAVEAVVVSRLPVSQSTPATCPTCGRIGTLVPVGDALFCAACGYASDSAAGCT